jgi:hypothetical protein
LNFLNFVFIKVCDLEIISLQESHYEILGRQVQNLVDLPLFLFFFLEKNHVFAENILVDHEHQAIIETWDLVFLKTAAGFDCKNFGLEKF